MIKKVVLSFPVDATDRSLTYDLVKLYDIRINILKAEIQAGKSGNLLVELEADTDKLDQGIAYLIENGVTVSPVSSKVSYDASLCIDCGNCVSAWTGVPGNRKYRSVQNDLSGNYGRIWTAGSVHTRIMPRL